MKSRSVRGYNKIICFCKHYFLAISIFCPNFCRQGPLGERARLGPHTCFQNRLVHPVLGTEPGTSVAKQTSLLTHFLRGFCRTQGLRQKATPKPCSCSGLRNCFPEPPAGPFHIRTVFSHPSGAGRKRLSTQRLTMGIRHPLGWPIFLGQKQHELH